MFSGSLSPLRDSRRLFAALWRSLRYLKLFSIKCCLRAFAGKFATRGTSTQIFDVVYVTGHSPDVTLERVDARNEMKAH